MSKSRNTVAPFHAVAAFSGITSAAYEVDHLIKSKAPSSEILRYAQDVQAKMAIIERYSKSFSSKELNRARQAARMVSSRVRDI